MFEEFRTPTLTERLRSSCFLPLAAFVVVLIVSDLEPIIGSSRIVYWIVDGIALAGSFGIGFAVRIAVGARHAFDWRAAVWLLICLTLSLLCVHVFVVLTAPFTALFR